MPNEIYIEDILEEAIGKVDLTNYDATKITFLFDTFEEVNARLNKMVAADFPVVIFYAPYDRDLDYDNLSDIYYTKDVTIYVMQWFNKGWTVADKKTEIFSWLGDLKNDIIEQISLVAYAKIINAGRELIHYDFGLIQQKQGETRVEKAVFNYDICGFEINPELQVNKNNKNC